MQATIPGAVTSPAIHGRALAGKRVPGLFSFLLAPVAGALAETGNILSQMRTLVTVIMSKLSVMIITKNEEKNIGRCLRSVAGIADEIIVVDSGSTDRTLDICRQFNATIFCTNWPGYGVQKNRALKWVNSEWVLSLDADEWVRTDLGMKFGKFWLNLSLIVI